MKKLISILTSLILTAALVFSFASCGNTTGASEPTSEKESVSTESKESVSEESESESESVFAPQEDASTNVRIITVNVAAPTNFEDSYIKYKGQTPADYKMNKRFVRLCALVEYFSPDVMMLQEVNGRGGWWDYLITNEDSLINRYPKYGYVGTTNLAGGTNGNGNAGTFYNQVYYNKNKFDLVAGGTFFCRDVNAPENQYTGDYEGVYAMSNTTTCSWAVLRDKKTNVTAVYASTHLCTRPSGAQCFRNYSQARTATEGLYKIAEEYKWGEKALPIVLCGDFNGDPSHANFYSYAHMTEDAFYTDSKVVAPVEDNSGTARVFGKDVKNNGIRIDYVFQQGAEVSDYKVLQGTFIEDANQTYCEYNTEPVLDGTQYDLTDHLPVYTKLKISGSGYSREPVDYVNPEILDDEVITASSPINATQTKIVFDSPDLLQFVGKNEKKGFKADIVYDGITSNFCLRLTMEKSRIDPVISIDYGALMAHLGLDPIKAENCKRIKIEYRLVTTKKESNLNFGASTTSMIPLSVGVNTDVVPLANKEWTSTILEFSGVDSAFWSGNFTYFGVATGVGLMAGDGIYIKSIELL